NNAEPLGANTLLYGNINSSDEDITISMPGVHEITEIGRNKSFGLEKENIHLFSASSGKRL
ncbi:MAG: sn-glycerol-3-phosphate ABC transporter ATP-binding protein UgpC, partial [Rhodobacterales bacterium]|nr:sn-glycerol-3-phosphate ABC transporter ATP-binding protein UgpC [Rhodobacterales bacterium]NCX55348.1 sn-glycerol-3-phosphate ABC transporter ATP-binding protein UgpC [Rhodobacterales bacterium]